MHALAVDVLHERHLMEDRYAVHHVLGHHAEADQAMAQGQELPESP